MLILHQGALGDFILTFPILVELRIFFGCIDAFCPDSSGRLALDMGLIDHAFHSDSSSFASLYTDQTAPLIEEKLRSYNAIIAFTTSPQLERSLKKIAGSHAYCLPPRSGTHQRIHTTEFLRQKLKNIFISDSYLKRNKPTLNSSDSRIRYPSKFIIHPGSGSLRKCWPLSNYIKLSSMLADKNLSTLFLFGPADRQLLNTFKDEFQKPFEFIFSDTITQLTNILIPSAWIIGNDSSVSHLAGYLGLTTFTIFGPSDPVKWRPNGSRVHVIRPLLPCSPCFETQTENCATPNCLSDTTPDTVMRIIHSVIN